MALAYHLLRDRKDFVMTESEAKSIIKNIKEVFPKEIPGFDAKRILDLGTGKGILIQAGLEAGLDIYALDIRDIYESDRSRFIQADAKDMPFEDNFFDLVFQRFFFEDLVGLQGFENMNELSPYLNEVYRILRPEGFIYSYCCGLPLFPSGLEDKLKKVFGKETETVYQKI